MNTYLNPDAIEDKSIPLSKLEEDIIINLSGGSSAENKKVISSISVSGNSVTAGKKEIVGAGTVSVNDDGTSIVIHGSDHPTSLKNPNPLIVGSKSYDGSTAVEIAASDLGLSAALKYVGTTTTALSDGSTTKTIVIGGSNHTASSGDVAFYGDKEFVWNGSAWEEFGFSIDLSGYKQKQSAVSSPSTSGSTTEFIDTITQDVNGVITATKKAVTFPTYKTLTINNSAGTAQVSFNGSIDKSLTLTKAMVGLGNVDNTADANKSVASAVTATYATRLGDSNSSYTKSSLDTALAGKLNTSGGTMTGLLKIQNEGTAWISFRNASVSFGSLGMNESGLKYWDGSQTLNVIHSGNVSDYALKYQGVSLPDNIKSGFGYNSEPNGYPHTGGFATFGNGTYGFQLMGYAPGAKLSTRGLNNGAWTDWKTIAFTDSNVASAERARYIETMAYIGTGWYGDKYKLYAQWHNSTICDWKSTHDVNNEFQVRVDIAKKLDTARTIWGQSFDGTGDVSGNLFFTRGYGIHTYDSASSTREVVVFGTDDTLKVGNGIRRGGFDTEIHGYNILAKIGENVTAMLINSSGNVGIGTTTPQYKLDVNGSFNATSGSIGGATIATQSWVNSQGFKKTDNNTTYTFAGGTNSFTVTPSGGTTQTVSVTPSISVATTSANGLMSSADKTKLNGIATGATKVTSDTVAGWGFTKNAGTVTKIKINGVEKTPSSGLVDLGTVGGEVNVQSDWNATSGDAFILNKPTIPTKTSQLTNDSNFTTATGHNHDSSYLKRSSSDTMTGNLTVTGTVSSTGGFFHTSDETLKNFIGDVDVDLDKLAALPKKYFTWKDGDDSVQIGTSAQEVQKVYPEIVNTDDTGKLSVDYTKLSVIALSAVDKLNEKNKELENRLHTIELLLSKLNISE